MGQYLSNNSDEDKRSASFQNIQSSQPNSDVSYISSSNYRGEVEDKRSARFQNIQSSQPKSDVSYNSSFKYRGEVEDKTSASFHNIQSSQPKSDVSYNSSKEVELLITYTDVLLKLEKELREKLRIKELLKEEERWIKHYCSSHKILLVGEGDFSFSACLAKAFGSAHNMVATSLDSKGKLCKKHWSCKPHLKELKRLGCLVLHGVDVYDMDGHPKLINVKFNRIIYNFPHAGHFPTLCERDNSLIQMHMELLSAFFFNAREMLTEDGEVHVSHRDDYPYNRWKITKLAKKAGLVLLEKVDFRKSDYPGYHNKRGGDIESNKTFPLGDCFTFKFTPRDKYTSFAHIEEDGLCESTWH